ncbi:phosphatidylinositol-bisphosphatase [Pseudovirgaria hyperparasitica]|uniref:Phosphatidylinositol-bisphosphatase n=1 Tax=Pseudovirgaria hyperparasitica TaxID=470096 RepID=A0A6A6W0D1_9PEZI|nr:phosphatidylinositol-bisphosphatase [Pseudovirgaria hyperparasitica]KAF2755037.1 phosphatidylinositol-bisphosphatase [Pseudovirgaria hyperparasitica]
MAATLPFRDINVHSSPSYYAFSSPSTPSAPTLVVERPSGDFRLKDGKLLGSKRVSSIAGILGIIKLRLDTYIIVITKAQPMGRIKGHMIYKVISTELLPLRERPLHDPDEDIYMSLVKAQLKGPMYFSYSFDLTNSFQRQAHADLSAPLWKRADDRFFWNRFVQSDLIDFRTGTGSGYGRQSFGAQPALDPYILPVMFGMMEIKQTSIKTSNRGSQNDTPVTFVLITRRSRHRAGTRYFSRGVDDQGNVSNFNETEQIIILNNHNSTGLGGFGASGAVGGGKSGKETQVLSFVQTRGSVPVFWAEVNTLKYTPKLEVRGIDSARDAASRHFEQQIDLYGHNFLVNLVNQKGRERRVKEAYEQMFDLLNPGSREKVESSKRSNEKFDTLRAPPDSEFAKLTYIYFDFHNETKGLKWHRTLELLKELGRLGFTGDDYFHGIDMPGDTGRMDVRNQQRTVVRTNCMDCLDRTNVVQSMLGRFYLNRMFVGLGLMDDQGSVERDIKFEYIFRNVWADNADVVSRAYSGTGALKTDFTRTGNRTNAGKFQDLNNSITRYVKNNFLDGPRQDAYDLFLGAYLPDATSVSGRFQFADQRPLFIQSIPYVLAASLFFVFVGSFTRRDATAMVWPLRLVMILCFVSTVACLYFIWSHGTLYVNWPKLNTPPWATDSYQEALAHVKSAPVIGGMVNVNKHERGKSDARLGYLEEGKKRIE